MQDWEFLLQKEGDRSWLPLESPTVEILEGRYRVVAQSRRQNAAVEIRIVHQSLDENSSRRRLQTRSARTNDRGLVVVMPYTHLLPGRWELRAQGDLMADMMGESWQATVELQVFAQEADWEWPLTNQPAATATQPSDFATVAAAEVPLQVESAIAQRSPESLVIARADRHLPEPESIPATVAQAVQQFDEAAIDRSVAADRWKTKDAKTRDASAAAAGHEPNADHQDADHQTVSLSDLRLMLTRTSFVARPGELLKLQGRIDASSTALLTRGLTMQVMLRDPQRSQILAEVSEPLPVQPLPLSFECEIEIPSQEQTHLLLGELLIVKRSPEAIATATGAIVAQLSFTVTIALEQLLATLSGNLPDADWLQPPLQFAEPDTPDLNLSLLDLVGTPKRTEFQPLQPTNSPAIPPQLIKPEPTRAPRPLQLPFADRPRPPEVEIQAAQRSTDLDLLPISDPEAAELIAAESVAAESVAAESAAAESAASTAIEPVAPEPLAIEVADLPLDLMMPSDPIRSPLAPPPRCEDAAFRSLNLQQRFWSRLNSLASDDELSGWLGHAAPDSNFDRQPEVEAVAAQEFVVEDEYPDRSTDRSPIDPPESMVIPEEEAIPVPTLELSAEELIAGSALLLRVKLPDVTARIYVKLWLRDAQSRSLLDGPRWLADFAPDGHGQLEARLALKVPFGCVELQFEAIAVEMATQRESHKSIALRPVVPPNLSVMSIDLDF